MLSGISSTSWRVGQTTCLRTGRNTGGAYVPIAIGSVFRVNILPGFLSAVLWEIRLPSGKGRA